MAIASNLSAFWILVANAWMQNPVGFTIRNGRAELTDFVAVITQRFAILEFVHTLGGAYILAGFFVLGISAWHLLRRQHVAFFTKSFRLAAVWTLVFSLFEIAQGHMNAEILGTTQPTKLAAMESHWETGSGAPMYLVPWPDAKNERNRVEALSVPKALSLLAHYDADAEVKGLKDFPPAERPPVLPVFLSFRAMVGLAFLFIGLSAWAFLRRRNPVRSSPVLLKALLWVDPAALPGQRAGLDDRRGRPPAVDRLRPDAHADAVSPISTVQVGVSALGFILVYTLLGIVDFYLLAKFARHGPADEARPEPALAPAGAEGRARCSRPSGSRSGASPGPSTSCSTASTSASAR